MLPPGYVELNGVQQGSGRVVIAVGAINAWREVGPYVEVSYGQDGVVMVQEDFDEVQRRVTKALADHLGTAQN